MSRTYFDALGRRAASKGHPLKSPRQWPRFAREAFARGWILQTQPTYGGGRDFQMVDDTGNKLTFTDFRFTKGGAA
jgi:hypothetical protein